MLQTHSRMKLNQTCQFVKKKVIRIPFGGFKDNDTVIIIKCQKFNLHKM